MRESHINRGKLTYYEYHTPLVAMQESHINRGKLTYYEYHTPLVAMQESLSIRGGGNLLRISYAACSHAGFAHNSREGILWG